MTTKTAGSGQSTELETTKAKLAEVHGELAELEGQRIPELKRGVAKAGERVQAAKLAEIVARGTPGFEDDIAAERSLTAAVGEQEKAFKELEVAEDRAATLVKAMNHLGKRIASLTENEHQEHMRRSIAEGEQLVEKGEEAVAEHLRNLVMLRTLRHQTTWPEELSRALEKSTRIKSVKQLIREGQARADRVKAGATIAEASR